MIIEDDDDDQYQCPSQSVLQTHDHIPSFVQALSEFLEMVRVQTQYYPELSISQGSPLSVSSAYSLRVSFPH
jgi:hypothetical protein